MQRHPRVPIVFALLLLLLTSAGLAQGDPAAPEPAAAVPWEANPKPILVHKLLVATYLQLWRNPGLEQASLTVRAESSLADWTLVSAVLLEIDGEAMRLPCLTESTGIVIEDPFNPFVGIDQGTAACELPYEVAEELLASDQVTVGFVLPDRTLDPKKLKPKQLARLRDLSGRGSGR